MASIYELYLASPNYLYITLPYLSLTLFPYFEPNPPPKVNIANTVNKIKIHAAASTLHISSITLSILIMIFVSLLLFLVLL